MTVHPSARKPKKRAALAANIATNVLTFKLLRFYLGRGIFYATGICGGHLRGVFAAVFGHVRRHWQAAWRRYHSEGNTTTMLFFARNKTFIALMAALVVALLVNSCAILPGFRHEEPPLLAYPSDYTPQVLVLYEPYPLAQSWLADVVPVPSYQGWTDERMTRDLNRMRDIGLHGLFLCLRPESLADAFVIERISRFYDLIQTQFPGFCVGLAIVPAQKTAISRQNVVSYVRKQGILDAECVFRISGHPFLGFAEDITLTDRPITDVSIRQWGNEWHVRPRNGDYDQVSAQESFIWVSAGYSGVHRSIRKKAIAQWPQPRDKHGDFFRLGLRKAFAAGAAIVCIDSWNDFVAGSFIEPNSYDQDLMCRVLREELVELARQRNTP